MTRRAPYGIVPSDFWESDEGRALQARGKDAVILSVYLRANRHATMLGYYRLRVEDVAHELPVLGTIETIRTAFAALHEAGWADYDEASACVWVHTMARERLTLDVGQVLDPEDHRRKRAQRLYETLPPNPFLEPFFDTYGKALRLKRRTFAQLVLDAAVEKSPTAVENSGGEGAYKGLVSPLQGASVLGTSTSVPGTDQEKQVRTTAAAPRIPFLGSIAGQKAHPERTPNERGNYRVIEHMAGELLLDPVLAAKYYEHPIDTVEDLVEATKRYCARKKVDYGRNDAVAFDVVQRACGSSWHKFQLRLGRFGGSTPPEKR